MLKFFSKCKNLLFDDKFFVIIQVKRIEDILKKVGTEYKNRSHKKPTEYSSKMQIKKLVDGMEKDIGRYNLYSFFITTQKFGVDKKIYRFNFQVR